MRVAQLVLACAGWLTALPAAHAYTVEITGAGRMDALLNRYLDIRRHRNDPNASPAELERLVAVTPQQIRDLLATQGYFSPTVQHELVQQGDDRVARFVIDPGAPTRIGSVDIRFRGAIAGGGTQEPARMAHLRRRWSLAPGKVFTQADWTAAKNALLKNLLVRDYPAAAIVHSQAKIDPQAQRADLAVEVDSGPAFTFGALTITGLARYRREMIEALNPIKPGDRYSQDKLSELQSRLGDTGYFRSAFATINVDPAHPQQVPVQLSLTENPRKRLGLGIGFSTDTGPGVEVNWLDRNFLDRQWRLESALRLNRATPRISTQLFLPALANGWTPSFDARYERVNIAREINDTIRTGARLTGPDRSNEQVVGVAFLADRQHVPGLINNRQALIGTYAYTRRRLDNLIAPRRGYVASVELDAGPKGGVNESSILRVAARATWMTIAAERWQPILRGQIGHVLIADRSKVPGELLFRTGGAQSVRGYGYNELGVLQNGAVVGGRVMAVASAELVYYITPAWGAAVFHDAGNAADRWRDLTWRQATGIGARWRSPIGPVNLDLAYAHATRRPRLHFSLGYVF